VGDTTLYRSEEPEGGNFGLNSYWTSSKQYAANHFALSAATVYGRDTVVWMIHADILNPANLDLRDDGTIHYEKFDARVAGHMYAAEGREWVIANVEDSDGRIVELAVYLGQPPLTPRLAPH